MYGENAPPSWARLPGARCRAVEHLTKLDGLKEFELFEGLEEGFFQDLAISAEVLELGASTALYKEGEPSGAVYFVGEGRVKLYRTSGGPKARDQILGVVGDGSVLGLGAALEGRTQGQGATALTGDLVFRSAPQRVARMLLNLATEEGRVTKRGVVFEPSLSRQEMAEATGISREALSRSLSRLARDGILELQGAKTITILEPAELRART